MCILIRFVAQVKGIWPFGFLTGKLESRKAGSSKLSFGWASRKAWNSKFFFGWDASHQKHQKHRSARLSVTKKHWTYKKRSVWVARSFRNLKNATQTGWAASYQKARKHTKSTASAWLPGTKNTKSPKNTKKHNRNFWSVGCTSSIWFVRVNWRRRAPMQI